MFGCEAHDAVNVYVYRLYMWASGGMVIGVKVYV